MVTPEILIAAGVPSLVLAMREYIRYRRARDGDRHDLQIVLIERIARLEGRVESLESERIKILEELGHRDVEIAELKHRLADAQDYQRSLEAEVAKLSVENEKLRQRTNA